MESKDAGYDSAESKKKVASLTTRAFNKEDLVISEVIMYIVDEGYERRQNCRRNISSLQRVRIAPRNEQMGLWISLSYNLLFHRHQRLCPDIHLVEEYQGRVCYSRSGKAKYLLIYDQTLCNLLRRHYCLVDTIASL